MGDTLKKIVVPEWHSNPQFEECYYCGGSGVSEYWDTWYEVLDEEECPFCNGAGGFWHEIKNNMPKMEEGNERA